jgi:hypothetical protein
MRGTASKNTEKVDVTIFNSKMNLAASLFHAPLSCSINTFEGLPKAAVLPVNVEEASLSRTPENSRPYLDPSILPTFRETPKCHRGRCDFDIRTMRSKSCPNPFERIQTNQAVERSDY